VRLLLEQNQRLAAEKQLEQLEAAAQELFVDVREAILSLKLSGEAGAGLVDGIRTYTVQFTRLAGIPVHVEADARAARLMLSPEAELQLLRIVQEALTNIRKHSGASRAVVEIQVKENALDLLIQDNGTGFDPQRTQPAAQAGFGMASMQDRARAIGAQISVTAAPGEGTRIHIHLPLVG
jgi:signal transduction histidine kinase